MKKSQISLFIMVGMILLLLAGIILFYYSNDKRGNSDSASSEMLAAQFPDLNLFVQKCVDETARKAVIHVGIEGGYYSNRMLSIFKNPGFGEMVPIYLGPGQYNVPTDEQIERSLGSYMEENLPACVKDFGSFEEKGMDITREAPNAEVKLAPSKVFFNVNYPLMISQGDQEKNMGLFAASVDAELYEMRDYAKEFADAQNLNPESLAISALSEIAYDHGIDFEINPYDGADVIILWKNDSIIGEPFRFSFAVVYADKTLVERI